MARTRAASLLLVAALSACATNPAPRRPSPNLPEQVGAAPQAGKTAVAPPAASAPAIDQFALQELFKRLTDVSFMTQLGSEMIIRKITYSGADKLPIPAYFFAPKDTLRRHAAASMFPCVHRTERYSV